jgi:hypothetical protein
MSLLLALTAGGAPAAVTGTAVWTEGNDTAVGVATYGPTGTAAVLEGNDTAVGVATYGPTGTAAVLEGNDTAVGVATYGPTATVAWTEGNDAISASVAVQVTATIAFTESDDTIAATGSGGSTPEADTGSHGGGFRRPQHFPPPKRRPVIQLIEPMLPAVPAVVTASTKWTEQDDHAVISASFTSFDFTNQDFELLLLLAVV